MANVIIGIHGLGNKPPKKTLEKWWKLAMIEGLQTYNYHSTLPKFELVYWADIMYEELQSVAEKDEGSPLFLKEKYVVAPGDFPIENHNTRKKIVDFLGKQLNSIFLNKDLSLNYSFIADAIVSKFFKDLEIYYTEDCPDDDDRLCKAQDLIKNRLIQVLKKYKSDRIMLISHSMGSIVAFDVLSFHALNTPVHTFITTGSPLGLPVVISKIAAEKKQKLPDENTMLTPPNVTKNWYNFSDILDRVAFNYKLTDDFMENKYRVIPIDFLVVNNYEINGKRNPHKSYGYLRTPEFSNILNDFIQTEKLTLKQKVFRSIIQIVTVIKYKFTKSNRI
ncbi:MAG TPA: hypothetical protein QF480_03115 [Bacteroidales bacterium]|jgi:hypothetical protein|nr:hypothetical protein [Bacteroidota bacterium]MAE09415.1 hypothetical protein [Bacteroidota bacterium]HJN05585.1 hypothetical protein [Bacteroidales bacterium]